MKKFFLLVVIIASWSASFSQTVKVKKEKSTVKGESLEGYAVDLEGTAEEVNAAFFKFAKTLNYAYARLVKIEIEHKKTKAGL